MSKSRKRLLRYTMCLLVIALVMMAFSLTVFAAKATKSPTPTPTPTPVATATPTPTPSNTPGPTNTPAPTPTPGGVSGLWSSAAEIANNPMTGDAWTYMLASADAADPAMATVSNQDSINNVEILAAGIVYARTGTTSYKTKVEQACANLVAGGLPADRTLAWAREVGAYAMAADLVGYRTTAFETWLRNMADNYVATDGKTLRGMFENRPNNWGTHGFGALCALYGYLGDTTNLTAIRSYQIQLVTGPKPAPAVYGDTSWQYDVNDLRQINPVGATKEGTNIDGIYPDDMRRGGGFSSNPANWVYTDYVWECQQGLVMGARIMDRLGMSIYTAGDSFLYRGAYALEERYASYGWQASGDDLWMMTFQDKIYGTNWAGQGQDPFRLWGYGKNAGWAYVTLSE